MFDKIKIYNRKDEIEVKYDAEVIFTLDISTGDCKYTLQRDTDTYGLEKYRAKYTLQKQDPLNKFTKEVHGWYFCEDYIIIFDERPIKIRYYDYQKWKDEEIMDFGWKDKIQQDLYNSEIFINNNNPESLWKYENRTNLKPKDRYILQINSAYGYDYDGIQKLILELQNIQNKELTHPINPNYLDFTKTLEDIVGREMGSIETFDFTYSELGEDKYLKLLELIDDYI